MAGIDQMNPHANVSTPTQPIIDDVDDPIRDPKGQPLLIFVLLPWKIDDFGDEVGGKNGTADYADYTDFLGLVVSVLTGRNR